MKVKGSFTLEAATIKILTHFTFPSHLYRILHLEQIEESPDEGDDEGGDDDEEEEVIVTETKVVCNVDCLSRGCACHTDDPKNLKGKKLWLQQNASIHSQSVKNAQLDVSGNSIDNVGLVLSGAEKGKIGCKSITHGLPPTIHGTRSVLF